jgi:hypothetical protein
VTATRAHVLDDAERCRRNGWGPGTRLIGDEGYGPSVIEITAVGEHQILARRVVRDGEAVNDRETTWTLAHRDWRPVTTPTPDTTGESQATPLGDRLRSRLRAGGTSPSWLWWLLRLWECPCGARHRSRRDHMGHELGCRDARAADGQG